MRAFSVVVVITVTLSVAQAALRRESFDREPPNWEGINNRSTAFEPKTVVQDFGYNAATSHAGGKAGKSGDVSTRQASPRGMATDCRRRSRWTRQ
jgi:hypothetical protein